MKILLKGGGIPKCLFLTFLNPGSSTKICDQVVQSFKFLCKLIGCDTQEGSEQTINELTGNKRSE